MRLSVAKARQLFPALKLPKPKRQPQAKSAAEELFALMVKDRGLPPPQREYAFAESIGRKWRFDYAWPQFMVAVEIEGLVKKFIDGIPYALGRHATFKGFEEDCTKYANANTLGWHVNRFNQRLVKNCVAIQLTHELLIARGWNP